MDFNNEPKNRDEWGKFVYDLKIEDLIKEFGPDLKKPTPEDFGLNISVLEEAKEADFKNVDIENYNKKLLAKKNTYETLLPVIGDLTSNLFFRVKKFDSLGLKYSNYKKKINKYPEGEILKIKEEIRLLEIYKKKAEYWYSLDGFEFENEVSNLFAKSGQFINVFKTKGTGDGGIDLILTHNDGTKVIVQCKAHKKEIGPHTVRDLYGTMQSEGIKDGVLISLSGVSSGARDFIKDKNISIVDVNGIIKLHEMTNN